MNHRSCMRDCKAAIAAVLLVWSGGGVAGAESASLGTLTVIPTGLEESGGRVFARLVNDAASFDGKGEGFRQAKAQVVDSVAVVVFEDLPYGDYALKIFHDENGNEKLDTNFVGMPKEKFGFSNDVMGRFGPPSFEQARFRFEEPAATLRVEMK